MLTSSFVSSFKKFQLQKFHRLFQFDDILEIKIF